MKTYNSLFWGIGALIVGLLLIFNPESAIILTVKLFGILSLTIGVVQLAVQLIQNRKAEHKTFPISSIIAIVWGALLLIRPEFWADFFMILLGLSMIFMSINQIATYRQARKSGIKVNGAFYIFPVLMALAGVTTVINPLFLAAWIVIFVAVWILAYGIVELVSFFSLSR